MLAFALSSAVIGFEGGLALHLWGAVTTNEFTLQLAITYIAMVLIGGLDSVAGAVIGAVLVTALPAIVPDTVTGIIGAQTRPVTDPPLLRDRSTAFSSWSSS